MPSYLVLCCVTRLASTTNLITICTLLVFLNIFDFWTVLLISSLLPLVRSGGISAVRIIDDFSSNQRPHPRSSAIPASPYHPITSTLPTRICLSRRHFPSTKRIFQWSKRVFTGSFNIVINHIRPFWTRLWGGGGAKDMQIRWLGSAVMYHGCE